MHAVLPLPMQPVWLVPTATSSHPLWSFVPSVPSVPLPPAMIFSPPPPMLLAVPGHLLVLWRCSQPPPSLVALPPLWPFDCSAPLHAAPPPPGPFARWLPWLFALPHCLLWLGFRPWPFCVLLPNWSSVVLPRLFFAQPLPWQFDPHLLWPFAVPPHGFFVLPPLWFFVLPAWQPVLHLLWLFVLAPPAPCAPTLRFPDASWFFAQLQPPPWLSHLLVALLLSVPPAPFAQPRPAASAPPPPSAWPV
mmetsp:Transcript_97715/g.193467  ORF Transcript_97715/g.193467 Transcript_97715/m.193467 type:complete len:247 (-) Transcript_97715:15-755(-)